MIYRKIGGLHWLRLGRLRIAFCIVAKPRPADPIAHGKLARDVLKASGLPHTDAYPWPHEPGSSSLQH